MLHGLEYLDLLAHVGDVPQVIGIKLTWWIGIIEITVGYIWIADRKLDSINRKTLWWVWWG